MAKVSRIERDSIEEMSTFIYDSFVASAPQLCLPLYHLLLIYFFIFAAEKGIHSMTVNSPRI